MDSDKTWLRSSLKVPSVQELVKGNPAASVPAQYIPPDQDPPSSISDSSSRREIPVIDKQLLLSAGDFPMNSELQKLRFF